MVDYRLARSRVVGLAARGNLAVTGNLRKAAGELVTVADIMLR